MFHQYCRCTSIHIWITGGASPKPTPTLLVLSLAPGVEPAVNLGMGWFRDWDRSLAALAAGVSGTLVVLVDRALEGVTLPLAEGVILPLARLGRPVGTREVDVEVENELENADKGVVRPVREEVTDDATDGGRKDGGDSLVVATKTPHFSGHVK